MNKNWKLKSEERYKKQINGEYFKSLDNDRDNKQLALDRYRFLRYHLAESDLIAALDMLERVRKYSRTDARMNESLTKFLNQFEP